MKNIKQYIKGNHFNYHVNIGLDHLVWALDGYKRDYDLDLDPDYQRGYVWTDKQKIDYVEYLIRNAECQSLSGKVIYFNMPNWLRGKQSGRMEIVDGKQRLNALLRWLNNEFSIFDNIFYKDIENKRVLGNVVLDFYIAGIADRKELVEWYIGMNTGGTVHTEYDLTPAYRLLSDLEWGMKL